MASFTRGDSQNANVIYIDGDLTYPEAGMAGDMCRKIVAECKSIVFDLTNVGYINSVGLALMATMVRLSKGAVTLRNAPRKTQRIVNSMGLNKILKME